MRLLLDTNVFLRMMMDDSLLSRAAKTAIADRDNEIYVSAICAWEIAIKLGIGKVRLSDPIDLFYVGGHAECEGYRVTSPYGPCNSSSFAPPPPSRSIRPASAGGGSRVALDCYIRPSICVLRNTSDLVGAARLGRYTTAIMFNIKRAYEPASPEDGYRVLVDRLWPRGVSKERAAIDLWLKEIAPSAELRKWFDHDPAKWTEFKKRYRAELKKLDEPVDLLKKEAKRGTVTLVYGARDEAHNHALVLRDYLQR